MHTQVMLFWSTVIMPRLVLNPNTAGSPRELTAIENPVRLPLNVADCRGLVTPVTRGATVLRKDKRQSCIGIGLSTALTTILEELPLIERIALSKNVA